MLTLDEIKNYIRVDFNDDDNTLNSLLKMSIEYIKESCGNVNFELETAKLCQLMLIDHWYNNRGAIMDKNNINITHGVNSLLIMLRRF